MSTTLALVVTTVATVVVFQFLDWLFWGTSYAHRHVFPLIPSGVLRTPEGADEATKKAAGKHAMFLGALVTVFAAIAFVPMVWMLGPQFAGARAVLLGVLVWAAFLLPAAWIEGIYYRIPGSMVRLHAVSSLARVVVGIVLVTWLLTVLRAW